MTNPLKDDSGNGRDLTAVNNPVLVLGDYFKFRQGYSFDGINQYLTSSAYSEDYFRMVVMFSFKTPIVSQTKSLLEIYINDGTNFLSQMRIRQVNAHLTFFHDSTLTTSLEQPTSDFIEAGKQYVVWYERNRSQVGNPWDVECHIFDGTSVINVLATTFSDALAPAQPGVVNVKLDIGRRRTGNYFNGQIYEVRLWDLAQTDATLDDIIDGNDPQYAFYAQGNEVNIYFFENEVYNRWLKDDSVFSDLFVRIFDISRIRNDDFKFSDIRAFLTSKEFTEIVIFSDILLKTLSRFLTDDIIFKDIRTKTKINGKGFSEVLLFGDNIEFNKAFFRDLIEHLILDDSIRPAFLRFLISFVPIIRAYFDLNLSEHSDTDRVYTKLQFSNIRNL